MMIELLLEVEAGLLCQGEVEAGNLTWQSGKPLGSYCIERYQVQMRGTRTSFHANRHAVLSANRVFV